MNLNLYIHLYNKTYAKKLNVRSFKWMCYYFLPTPVVFFEHPKIKRLFIYMAKLFTRKILPIYLNDHFKVKNTDA